MNEQQIKFNNIRARLRYRRRDSERTLEHSRIMMMTTITIIVVVVVIIIVLYLHVCMNYIGSTETKVRQDVVSECRNSLRKMTRSIRRLYISKCNSNWETEWEKVQFNWIQSKSEGDDALNDYDRRRQRYQLKMSRSSLKQNAILTKGKPRNE